MHLIQELCFFRILHKYDHNAAKIKKRMSTKLVVLRGGSKLQSENA